MARSSRAKQGGDVDVLAGWALVLMDGLAAAGVVDIVATPGRSALPYFLAAKRDPRLRVRHILDERAAAFFALGQARVTGRPSVVMCTGGSAGAHFYPAVIEAAMSFVPMLIITCDRPLDEKDCGVHQSIDQTRMFGPYARMFIELGVPEPHPSAVAGLRRAAVQAVNATLWPTPGPVQINARSRTPRVPAWDAVSDVASAVLARQPTMAITQTLAPDAQVVAEVAAECRAATKGIIVAGPAPLAQASARRAVGQLAAATGYPLLVSATSQLRFGGPPGCAAFDLFLMSPAFGARHAPDSILQLGAMPLSSAWSAFEGSHQRAHRIVIARHGWPDSSGTASRIVAADPQALVPALVRALAHPPAKRMTSGARAWRDAFAAADRAAWKAVDENLRRARTLTEGAATRETVASLPRGGLLAVGNSMPVRHVDHFCPGALADVGVLSQRGASGIDGLIAGAAGSAFASGRPVTLLLGDVSFLHDLTGLATAEGLTTPLTIVVLHNDGGRISELSSAGATAGAAEALTVFPHGIADLAPAARMFGHRFRRVSSVRALRSALTAARSHCGCSVIQVDVPPRSMALQYRELWKAVSG